MTDRENRKNEDLVVSIKVCQKVDLEGQELEEFEIEYKKQSELKMEELPSSLQGIQVPLSRQFLHPLCAETCNCVPGDDVPIDTDESAGDEVQTNISHSIEQPLRTSSTSISRLVRQPSGAVIQMLGNDIVKPGSANWVRPDVLIDGFEVPKVGN